MRALDVIRKKRDGGVLTREEIALVVNGYTEGSVPDYQMSAWLMAVVLRGMSKAEIADLTEVMLASGKTLRWPTLPGKKVDKHSTGGVGDKTSFLLAPIISAAGADAPGGAAGGESTGWKAGATNTSEPTGWKAGATNTSEPTGWKAGATNTSEPTGWKAGATNSGGLYVPMISGRGLGHTGGTLDKLESIPGFNVTQSAVSMQAILEKCGCAIVGQSAEIVPADKKIYALRDVSATVESPALICASIMSKKLAEGIDALVLDVKTGSGAFMKTEDDAAHLAELMVETGERMGKRTAALITDMSQPLGRTVGNALEILECIEILRAGPDGVARNAMSEDLRTLSIELSAWMLYLVERVPDVAAGRALAEEMLTSGAALARFRDMLRLQGGGDISVVDKPSRLPRAANTVAFTAERGGFITAVACEQVGVASLLLGGGRSKKDDVIDHAVGLEIHKKIGDEVRVGETICVVHYNADERLADALTLLREAYVIGATRVEPPRLVRREITGAGQKPQSASKPA